MILKHDTKEYGTSNDYQITISCSSVKQNVESENISNEHESEEENVY